MRIQSCTCGRQAASKITRIQDGQTLRRDRRRVSMGLTLCDGHAPFNLPTFGRRSGSGRPVVDAARSAPVCWTSASRGLRPEGSMAEVYIIAAVRTPIGIGKPEVGAVPGGPGGPGGARVARGRPPRRRGSRPGGGCDPRHLVTPVYDQGANLVRLATLQAGLPAHVPAVSLNRMCGSGQQAIHLCSMGRSPPRLVLSARRPAVGPNEDQIEINEAFASVVLAWQEGNRRRPRRGQPGRGSHRTRPPTRRQLVLS